MKTTSTNPYTNPDGYIRLNALADFLQVHRVTLYRWIRLDQFPKPIKLNGVTLFKNADVVEYLDDKERS